MSKVKHIALVKFKTGTTSEQIDQIFETLLDVTESVPGVEDYVAGANISPEGLDQGYTHGLVMTFQDVAARDTYLVHPDHERAKAAILPHVEAVTVVDFEV